MNCRQTWTEAFSFLWKVPAWYPLRSCLIDPGHSGWHGKQGGVHKPCLAGILTPSHILSEQGLTPLLLPQEEGQPGPDDWLIGKKTPHQRPLPDFAKVNPLSDNQTFFFFFFQLSIIPHPNLVDENWTKYIWFFYASFSSRGKQDERKHHLCICNILTM